MINYLILLYSLKNHFHIILKIYYNFSDHNSKNSIKITMYHQPRLRKRNYMLWGTASFKIYMYHQFELILQVSNFQNHSLNKQIIWISDLNLFIILSDQD
jgi:hypothetical protein